MSSAEDILLSCDEIHRKLSLSCDIVCTDRANIVRRIDATDSKVTDIKRRFVSLFARRSGWKIDPDPCLPVNAGRDIKCRCKVHSGVYWQCRYIDDGHAARKSHSYYGSPCSITKRVICGQIVTVNDFILTWQQWRGFEDSLLAVRTSATRDTILGYLKFDIMTRSAFCLTLLRNTLQIK